MCDSLNLTAMLPRITHIIDLSAFFCVKLNFKSLSICSLIDRLRLYIVLVRQGHWVLDSWKLDSFLDFTFSYPRHNSIYWKFSWGTPLTLRRLCCILKLDMYRLVRYILTAHCLDSIWYWVKDWTQIIQKMQLFSWQKCVLFLLSLIFSKWRKVQETLYCTSDASKGIIIMYMKSSSI